MNDSFKTVVIAISTFVIVGWVGLKMFRYFSHATPPSFSLKGIENNGTYAHNANGTVSADTDYKVALISISLDGKEIVSNRIKSKQFDVPFSIDTTAVADGQHTLTIDATDASYHRNKTTKNFIITIDNTPLRVAFTDTEYNVDQGKTLLLRIQANKKLAKAEVRLFNKIHNFYPSSDESTLYECFVPIECEERPTDHMITTDVEDLVGNKTKLSCKVQVRSFEFKKQHGFTVQTSKLNEEKEISMSMRILDEALEKWSHESPKRKLWKGPFEFPVTVQRTSTPFGEIRMTPERGRYMHKGLDLINRPKCVVWAAQDGKVIIKDRFFLTGNTVVIDHGLGITTLYAHLEEFADLEIGDTIKKGNPVGKLGMTGYATGYHLHWEIRVNNVAVDPTEWTSTIY